MEEKFSFLKRELGGCYDGDKYIRLKCILFDQLPTGAIANPDFIAHDLFNKLQDRGLISPTNINLLLEITELIEVRGAKDLVREYMNENEVQNTDEPQLSSYRKQLIKAMKEVTPGELQPIIAFYQIGQYGYRNICDVVLHLETHKKLADKPEKIQRFANCLNPIGKDILLGNKISDKSFNQALKCFSTWYDARSHIKKLKVLYHGYIADADLHNASTTMDLMKQLTDSGHLSPKNLTLLYDTIKATKQFGIVDKLRVHIPVPSFSSARERIISTFSHHQQKFLNLGNVLIEEDVIKIDKVYNDPPKKFKDGWNLILYLQHKTIICEAKLDEFVETLKSLEIPHAVEIFTKEAQLHLTLKRKRGRLTSSNQHPSKKAVYESKSSSERNLDEDQPPPGQSTNPVEILDHLNKHKGNLKIDDALEFTDKLQELVNFFSKRGLKLPLMTEGCIVFHLSVIDKYALINLREIHDSGKLLKDLAEILVAEENQQKLFQEEWITHIDEIEYHKALCVLEENAQSETFIEEESDASVESKPALTENQFIKLKITVANWFDRFCPIKMIKVLYEDLVPDKGKLENASSMMELLKLLYIHKELNRDNPTLIYDTISVTKQDGVWDRIHRIAGLEMLHPTEEGMLRFNEHRQKVMRLGNAMTDSDTTKISQMYEKTMSKHYEDSWSLIIDLERNHILSKKNMNEFIEMLRINGLNHLINSVDVNNKVACDNSWGPKDLICVAASLVVLLKHLYYLSVNIVLAVLVGAIIIILIPNIMSYPPCHYFENYYDTTEYGEMIEKRFQTMNGELSRYYEGERYYWLRFCLIDYLSVSDITDAIGNDLFNALELKGLITPTNVSLLLEITKLTEVKSAEDLIRGYIKKNKLQHIDDDTMLSDDRKQLFKAMRQVDTDALKRLVSYYDLKYRNLENIWNVVFKLEIEVLAKDPYRIKNIHETLVGNY